MSNLDQLYEDHGPYATHAQVMTAAIEDGYTAAGAEAVADAHVAAADEEFAIQQEGEIRAENAWLWAAENDPRYDEGPPWA